MKRGTGYEDKSMSSTDFKNDALSSRRTGCALAAPPPIDGKHIVAETGAKKRTILLDAKRRPLQARVRRRAVIESYELRTLLLRCSLFEKSSYTCMNVL